MDDETASAIPSDLTHWAYWTSGPLGLNQSLHGMGVQVNQAIDDFNSAAQEPRLIGNVDHVGNDVIGYAARNGVIDDWVGKVGKAFMAADHKGVPSGIYRANEQDFISGFNTASEADLARLVGDDPAKQADEAANGAALAARLKQAEDANDEGQIQAILRQLPGQSQEFAFAFFNELGPDQTIKTLIAIDHNDDLLQTFDNALGQASQHPNWDPKFTSALLDPLQQAWGQLPSAATGRIQVSMLKYGTFSEDFLTQSADYVLFSGKAANMEPGVGLVVFNALDRNPDAAYHYLTGHYQAYGENLPRVQYLLRHSSMDYTIPGQNTALGNLIADAGFSGNGRLDNSNQLLQAIGSIDNQNMVADDVRPGIERLLAGYIGNFATYTPPKDLPPEGRFTWQERLFMIAEMNARGNLDEGRMTDLQNAAAKWLASQMTPMEYGPAGAWFGQAGALYGLTLLPARKAGWNNYDMDKAGDEFWKTTINFATGFLPGWAHQLKDVPLTMIESIGTNYLDSDPGRAQVNDWDLYHKAESSMVPKLVLALAAGDPNFFPPSLRGRPLSDPQVNAYLNGILTSVADPTHNPSFPSLPLSKADQDSADAWANAIRNMTNTMQNYYRVPTEGYR